MDINQPSEFMDRKGVGFPKEGTVMFFPGFLDQIDKISLNAWSTILSKTDNTFLAITAKPEHMMPKMKYLVENSSLKRRILFLPWLGENVHRFRQNHATLCMGSLCPTKVQTGVAESLGMGTGLLVIDDDRGTPLCVGRGNLPLSTPNLAPGHAPRLLIKSRQIL
jgi:hypothetical protein